MSVSKMGTHPTMRMDENRALLLLPDSISYLKLRSIWGPEGTPIMAVVGLLRGDPLLLLSLLGWGVSRRRHGIS